MTRARRTVKSATAVRGVTGFDCLMTCGHRAISFALVAPKKLECAQCHVAAGLHALREVSEKKDSHVEQNPDFYD